MLYTYKKVLKNCFVFSNLPVIIDLFWIEVVFEVKLLHKCSNISFFIYYINKKRGNGIKSNCNYGCLIFYIF